MAPRRKNASIKSTGSTSSKAEPLPDWVKDKSIAKPSAKHLQTQQGKGAPSSSNSPADPPRPPPLFAAGTKTPINLLNERIQKHHSSAGWLRPTIEARRVADKGHNHDEDGGETSKERWTFVVTLTKTNKADQSNPFAVRLDARDPSGLEGSSIALGSKEEAKHWGATYALFRLCSNLSLYQVLPPGPREYWKKLSTHKADAPDHINWLWAADPFEAVQKLTAEKEAKKEARSKREEEGEKGPRLSKAWQEAREVRMSKELRDTVEVTVRKALQAYPTDKEEDSANDVQQTSGQDGDEELISSLLKLGFRRGHARSATSWLALARRGESTSTASLASIHHLSDLDACLEYLAIFCPEEDLPPAFAPSVKADSFITSSASAGEEETLAMRWVADRLVKVAGFPRPAVSKSLASLSSLPVEEREGACVDVLLRKLSEVDAGGGVGGSELQDGTNEKAESRAEERMTLEAVLGPERVKPIPPTEKPLTGAAVQANEMYDVVICQTPEDIRLRVCPGSRSRYPEEGNSQSVPTFIVASSTLPAYLRLALMRRVAKCLLGLEEGYNDWAEMVEAGQGGVLLAMVEELESCWEGIVNDPPELAVVMAGLLERPRANAAKPSGQQEQHRVARGAKALQAPPKLIRDARVDAEMKEAQARLWQSASYVPMQSSRAGLPAMASRQSILSLLQTNRLIIVAGETGCGKTTQCPQFILDDCIERGEGSLCNIIVTQPRRLSAMGVAARVAAERCEDLNGQGRVGYAIRGERKAGKATRLLFSTTGVLLRRLSQQDRNLSGVSHIFVDEVHERGVESDLLLLELREVLKRNPTLRVVLMSATIDQDTFSRYFDSAPVITIPGRTHPVTDFYLEDVRAMIGAGKGGEEGKEQQQRRTGIDYDAIAATTRMICQRAVSQGEDDGAILIFCPGVGEIRLATDAVQKAMAGAVEVLPLHANLTPDEQRRVFKRAKRGCRKVVVSTNVAETSITIDDVVYVIDVGLVKETRYDPTSGLTRLIETRCSKAASRQRRGRAGRVRPGECFKLYSRGTEEHKMEAQQVPEIMRMSLENLVLTVKALKGEAVDVKTYLGMAISPPSIAAMERAVQVLTEMNIIKGEGLSALGKHLSLLPLDVRLAKLLVLGCVFHCLGPLLTVASIMSSKPLFAGPYEKREELSAAKLRFQVGCSDLLTDVKAFDHWTAMRRSGSGASEVRRWCEEHFVSPSTLRDIANTRADLLGNLIELGFAPFNYGKGDKLLALDANSTDVNLKRSLLLAGLYPSVVRIARPRATFDQSSSGTVQRESEAKQVRYFDSTGQRVFLHPSSILFSNTRFQSDFLTFFAKTVSKAAGSQTGEKVYLRDANEVPVFAMLLFGGRMKVHRLQGGISLSCGDNVGEEGWIKLRASARIATLIQHLRFLLDAALEKSFESPTENVFERGLEAEVRDCLTKLLDKDGLS